MVNVEISKIIEDFSSFFQLKIHKLNFSYDKIPKVQTINKNEIHGLRNLVSQRSSSNDPEHAAIQDQWVEYALIHMGGLEGPVITQILKDLNNYIMDKIYFVGNKLGPADVLLYYLLYNAVLKLTFQEKEKYLHFSRWFNHIQQNEKARLWRTLIPFSKCLLYVKMTSFEREACSVVPIKEAKRFLKDCLLAVKTMPENAEQLAEVLVAADYRGHYSHGLNRLEIYITDIMAGVCDQNAKPKILNETAATAWVDGQNGLGPVVGNFCMNLAVEKAKSCGIGWVAAKNSNHFGIAGWYTLIALKHNMIGMSFTNTSPFLCPTRAKEAALGTNPISVAAPGINGDNFFLDMATTAVAVGKIEMQQRKKEPIPEGWAVDENGHPTTDPDVAQKARRLMPLGGSELTSGYKGYGLCHMVELFCGILAGAAYGPQIRKWGATDRKADLGQCFVAINPECFAPNFKDRVTDLNEYLRNLEPADGTNPVLVAGDLEKKRMEIVDKEGGIRYHSNQIKAANDIAENLKVTPLKLEKSMVNLNLNPKC